MSDSLKKMQHVVSVPEEIRVKAKAAVEAMLLTPERRLNPRIVCCLPCRAAFLIRAKSEFVCSVGRTSDRAEIKYETRREMI